MATQLKPVEEMSTTMEKATEKVMEQSQNAMQNYFEWLQKTMSGSQWADNELTKKLISNWEQNIATTQLYVQQISQARDIQDVMKIQTDFVQAKMATFAELGEIYVSALRGAAGARMYGVLG
ncbi:MAG TPA: phasin family protein [Xanthobacteraceae bacterium]|jgi:hypothetical protein|nr:phasin family protein [Xanthobacteraceae bacterium]